MDNLLNDSENDPTFMQAAVAQYVESNGGSVRSKIEETTYFVMYVTYRELIFDPKFVKATVSFKEAVAKALGMETKDKKYKELQTVFQRFGYFYPSSISLGGSILYPTKSRSLSDTLSFEEEIQAIDTMLSSSRRQDVHTLGGDINLTGCQNWIDSVRVNQSRIRFKKLRPLYELLDDPQRMEVLQLYDEHKQGSGEPILLPKGIHFDGAEAEDQAIELSNETTVFRMIMTRNMSDNPGVECTKRYGKDAKDVENYSSLDISSGTGLPGSLEFALASQGAYKERNARQKYDHNINQDQLYDLAYVTYKELYLPDQCIQLTNEFKKAIDNALQVGNLDSSTYGALQDVFQKFGYYYPARLQIGGRLILKTPPHGQNQQEVVHHMNVRKRYEHYKELYAKKSEKINEVSKSQVIPKRIEPKKHEQEHVMSTNNELVARNTQIITREAVTKEISKLVAQTERLNAAGGNSLCLLTNDMKGWIESLKDNQFVTQRGKLRPLYKLLDRERRHQVETTYRNMFNADDRVAYNSPLKTVMYEGISTDAFRPNSRDVSISTEPLFEQLLSRTFPDNGTAIEFCRLACAAWGFSIVEERITDKFICVYCSHSGATKDTAAQSHYGQRDTHLCQWGIALSKKNESWCFQKFPDSDEAVHNHRLKSQDEEELIMRASSHNMQESVIIKLEHAIPSDRHSTYIEHIKYGDMVYIKLIDSGPAAAMYMMDDTALIQGLKLSKPVLRPRMSWERQYVSASECLEASIKSGYLKLETDKEGTEDLLRRLKDSDSDYLWRVLRYPSDHNNTQQHDLNQLTDDINATKPLSFLAKKKGIGLGIHTNNSFWMFNHCYLDFSDYVLKGDFVLFESQAAFECSYRMYLYLANGKRQCVLVKGPNKPGYHQIGWHIIKTFSSSQSRPQWKTTLAMIDELRAGGYKFKDWQVQELRKRYDWLYDHEDDNSDEEYDKKNSKKNAEDKLSQAPDKEKLIEQLQSEVTQGLQGAHVKLAELYWKDREYRKALDVYEDAILVSEPDAYCKLGSLYQYGFCSEECEIPKNREIAIMYYSIGGFRKLNDATMKVAELYEDDRSTNFKASYRRALRWYERILKFGDVSRAWLAIGRIKHALARATDNPIEANELREGAFQAFVKVAGVVPYAKFMIAMYHLYGWVEQPDSKFAFETLLSLVESGINEVLYAIAECYSQGNGVQRDVTLAAAYKELAKRMNT
ncbi:hypothetical protein EC973_001559 [Apophysomyces ossiformis]|uniref:Uncharacterized protein n=1 Tax=Apophysomyces ossiformis TaxID=679940 RepID=A0A8H7EP72_9FUNG|nr:hypothetical protein EC973_001559 [Apophysomyces ossiformis]